MTNFYEDLVGYLESKAAGTRGRDLFINEMPAGCNQGVVLLDTYVGTPIDEYLPGYYRGNFRVAVRSPDQVSGRLFAKKIVKLLKIERETAMGSTSVKLMLPLNLPRSFRRSDGGYWEFQIDVDVNYVDLMNQL